jgi:hypothetical protein
MILFIELLMKNVRNPIPPIVFRLHRNETENLILTTKKSLSHPITARWFQSAGFYDTCGC